MTAGNSDDMLARLRSLVPAGWFASLTAPVRDVVFGGLSDALAFSYGQLQAVRAQTRITTASGWFLDLIGWDFFGARFLRRSGESDATWRARIINEILRPRATRAAIIRALSDLTGWRPIVIELFNPQDCGGYGSGRFAYGASGCWGSRDAKNELLITAFRPSTVGIANVNGFGGYLSGYGAGSAEYVARDNSAFAVSDAEIYRTVADTIAAGVKAWVAIESKTALLTDNGDILTDTPGIQLTA